jgi:hypothetical protein
MTSAPLFPDLLPDSPKGILMRRYPSGSYDVSCVKCVRTITVRSLDDPRLREFFARHDHHKKGNP